MFDNPTGGSMADDVGKGGDRPDGLSLSTTESLGTSVGVDRRQWMEMAKHVSHTIKHQHTVSQLQTTAILPPPSDPTNPVTEARAVPVS